MVWSERVAYPTVNCAPGQGGPQIGPRAHLYCWGASPPGGGGCNHEALLHTSEFNLGAVLTVDAYQITFGLAGMKDA